MEDVDFFLHINLIYERFQHEKKTYINVCKKNSANNFMNLGAVSFLVRRRAAASIPLWSVKYRWAVTGGGATLAGGAGTPVDTFTITRARRKDATQTCSITHLFTVTRRLHNTLQVTMKYCFLLIYWNVCFLVLLRALCDMHVERLLIFAGILFAWILSATNRARKISRILHF